MRKGTILRSLDSRPFVLGTCMYEQLKIHTHTLTGIVAVIRRTCS